MKSLTHAYGGRTILDSLDARFPRGTLSLLRGANGCGKTTLLRLACGLESPNAGSFTWDGVSIIPTESSWKAMIGVVPDSDWLFDELSPGEHLNLHSSLYGLDPAEGRRRGEGILELVDAPVGQPGYWTSPVCELSFGTRKKLSLALALIHSPKLVFMDEPLNGMDIASLDGFASLLNLLKARGRTVIMVSHVLPSGSGLNVDQVYRFEGGHLEKGMDDGTSPVRAVSQEGFAWLD